MPYAQIGEGVRIYYELTGAEDAPVVLQFGGGLFGRHNFGLVNDGFRERFRLLSFDARGYGASDHPREKYTIEGWADDAAGLRDSVGLETVFVHVTTQAVGARFMESPEGENIFQLVRDIVGLNDPYTVRQACLAMEEMDLSPLVPTISRPLLMTNGTHDVLCPPDLASSGLGARRMAELNANVSLVEFPDIGHADLVECPADAVRIVCEFFEPALVPA